MRTAWAQVIAAKLFEQFLLTVDSALTAFHASFGGKTLAALSSDLKSLPMTRTRRS